MHPLERLINLVAMLLNAARPLTFEQIRELMPVYAQGDPASAKRMFERDKDTLREAGVPVELAPTDAWEVEQGYTIPKERYYLPEIRFTPDEIWALFVAVHAPPEEPQAEQALRKLFTGVDADLQVLLEDRAITPGVAVSGPRLGAVADALARRRAVRFRYRPSTGKPGQREVHPYALVFRGGNWYLVGMDMGRGDVRSFRLSRILSDVQDSGPAGAPPPEFDASRVLEAGPWGLGRPVTRARVAFSPKVSWWAGPATPGARVLGHRRDGWTEVDVPAGDEEQFVAWLLGFGPEARVDEPAAFRDRVVATLQRMAAGA